MVFLALPHYAWAQAQTAGSAPPGYVLVEEDVIITFANEPRESFGAAESFSREIAAAIVRPAK